MRWIRNIFSTILQGIKKGWNWLTSKLSNMFGSNKKPQSPAIEEEKTESQQKEQVIETPEIQIDPEEEKLKSTLQSLNINQSYISAMIESCKSTALDMCSDQSLLQLMRNNDNKEITQAVLQNKWLRHEPTSQRTLKSIKDIFKDQNILDLLKNNSDLREVFLGDKSCILHSGILKLIADNEQIRHNVKKHIKLARAVVEKIERDTYEKFHGLFSQEESVLSKSENYLNFAIEMLYEVEGINYIKLMNCVKSEKDVILVQQIMAPGMLEIFNLRVNFTDENRGDLSRNNRELQAMLLGKFLDHLDQHKEVYRMFFNLPKNSEYQDLNKIFDPHIKCIDFYDTIEKINKHDTFLCKTQYNNIFYHKNMMSAKYFYITPSINSAIVNTAIDEILDMHLNRVKEVLEGRLPDYLKEKLPDLPPNISVIVNKALSDEGISTLNVPDSLQQTCLAKVVKNLNQAAK